MARSRVKMLAAIGAVIILTSTVAGCGRRGGLLPPPDPAVPGSDGSGEVTKSGIRKRPRNYPIRPPNQPFVLDPLL